MGEFLENSHLEDLEIGGRIIIIYYVKAKLYLWPMPVAVRSKAWVYGRSLTRIVGSNPA